MKTKTNFKRKLKIVGGTLTIVSVFLIATAFNKADFPKPNGPYKVGNFHMELKDSLRGNRKILFEVYYPSHENKSTKQAYHPNPENLERELSELYGIPKVLIKKISRSKVDIYHQAEPVMSETGHPILFFSHGYNGNRFQNTYLLPQLASQGYVVVSIEHTGSAVGTVLSDGEIGGFTSFDSIMKNGQFSIDKINEWSADQIFALDKITDMVKDRTLPVKLNIDFDKVGVFGHSFGGATSAHTLTVDPRFKAGINLDGFYFGEGYKTGFEQPFMEIRADNKSAEEITEKELAEWKMNKAEYEDFLFTEWNKRIEGLARNGYESYKLKYANHMSFSDFSLMFPFGFITAPHREEHHEATYFLVRQFFNKHLNVMSTNDNINGSDLIIRVK